MADEKTIPPPKNPITIRLNGLVLAWYFDSFMDSRLKPLGYSVEVTSEYRDPAKNDAVGGVSNSAHLHNLARDFVIKNSAGVILTEPDARKVFRDVVEPNWPGYAEFEPSVPGSKGWHIHVNLPRTVSTWTGLATGTGITLAVYLTIKSALEGHKNG